MVFRDLMLFCLSEAENYFSNYQKSIFWLKSLSSGYSDRYLERYWQEKKLIEINDNNVHLLDLGREILKDKFPLSQWRKQKWDGNWRVIIYDIPEKQRLKRDKLRKWLKRFGFGRWQNSVWVTPHPIEDEAGRFLAEVGLKEMVGIYLSKRISGISDKNFAEGIWQLARLNNIYRTWSIEFQEKGRREYLEFLANDPMLPVELLPDDWKWEDLMKKCLAFF